MKIISILIIFCFLYGLYKFISSDELVRKVFKENNPIIMILSIIGGCAALCLFLIGVIGFAPYFR